MRGIGEVRSAIAAIAARLDPAIAASCRTIRPGDGDRLTPAERAALGGAVESVRCASGAARVVARGLLRCAGAARPIELVPQRPDGPIWPAGYLGSLTHDRAVAAAAIAPRGALLGIGIDVEPLEPLPAEIYAMVVTPGEHAQIAGDPIAARLLFVIKEAVYKATHPVDRIFLDHHDVEVDLAAGVARTRSGRRVAFAADRGSRLVALAVLRA